MVEDSATASAHTVAALARPLARAYLRTRQAARVGRSTQSSKTAARRWESRHGCDRTSKDLLISRPLRASLSDDEPVDNAWTR
jgi:hypothetical protein